MPASSTNLHLHLHPPTHTRTSSGLKGRAGGLTLGCLPKLERASSGLRLAMAAKSSRGTTLIVPRCTQAVQRCMEEVAAMRGIS